MGRASLAAAATLFGLIACGADGVLGPEQRLSLSFSTQSSAITVGSDVLVITKAEVVLREIELEGEEDACAPAQGPSQSESESESESECEEFEAGPFLLELPLNSVEAVVSVNVPAGTYEEVEFEIHKVSGNDPADAAFLAAHPGFVGKSIRIEGTFNGQPFVFETDLDVEQEMELEPPLVISQTPSNITIRVDFSTWFLTAGGVLINPATANPGGANESLVEQNIKRSFRAFEDEDEDGEIDDD